MREDEEEVEEREEEAGKVRVKKWRDSEGEQKGK